MAENPVSILEDQIRQCFGRVVYTHKTHLKMADGCNAIARQIKLSQILLSGLTASGALSLTFSNSTSLKLATAVVSLGTLVLAAYTKNFDPGASAQKHLEVASELWDIRETYLSLLTDLRENSICHADAMNRRDELQAGLATIYKRAPQTNDKAYGEAQVGLKKNEEYTFTDSEIDVFLPNSLRKAGEN